MKAQTGVLSLIALALLQSGCNNQPPNPATQPAPPSAAKSAQSIKIGMPIAEAEKVLGQSGGIDGVDPNRRHYPTEDGSVIITYRDGVIALIETTNDR
jgi:hypothetical protein